jgi:hypothetical protein
VSGGRICFDRCWFYFRLFIFFGFSFLVVRFGLILFGISLVGLRNVVEDKEPTKNNYKSQKSGSKDTSAVRNKFFPSETSFFLSSGHFILDLKSGEG